MTSAAHDESYGDPRWRRGAHGPWSCWGGGWGRWGGSYPGWNGRDGAAMGPQPWGSHPFGGPHFIAKPVLIVLTILGFIWWWPIGLALLAVTLCRRHMFCGHRRWGGWQHAPSDGAGWKNWFGGTPPTSGNRAFDDYRAETLRRLEDEQKEFAEFLERLRFAKDKSEFDQFMGERRNRPNPSEPSPEPSN